MKSRLFIKDPSDNYYQLFSLIQNKNDGSIYLCSSEFTNFEWLGFQFDNGTIKPSKFEQDKNGHLSFHGSGQVHVKDGGDQYKLPISGHNLLNLENNEIGFRHLFTLFPKQSTPIIKSNFFQHKNDRIINSSESIKPFVMVAFALPQGLDLELKISFNIDDMSSFPGGFLGSLTFPLEYHNFWVFLYRTKNMEDWPKKNMLQYSDGAIVPMFFGKPGKIISGEFRLPLLNLEGNKLTVDFNKADKQ